MVEWSEVMELTNKYLIPIVISIISFFLVNTYTDYKTLLGSVQELMTQQAIVNAKIETLTESLNRKFFFENDLRSFQEQFKITFSNLELRVTKLEEHK